MVDLLCGTTATAPSCTTRQIYFVWHNGRRATQLGRFTLCGTTAAELHSSVDLLCGTTATANVSLCVCDKCNIFCAFLSCPFYVFNVILCSSISWLLWPYAIFTTFINEAFTLVTNVKYSLLSPLPNMRIYAVLTA